MRDNLGFAFSFQPGAEESYALLLSRSIRQFGGKHKAAPIYAMLALEKQAEIKPKLQAELEKLDVELVLFQCPVSQQTVYYSTKSIAAGAAEAHVTGKVGQLIYTDVDSLILNDPSLLLLQQDKKLGIRPVDIKNIGSSWEEPIDSFWSNIYSLLKVNQSNLFPVISTVETVKLRAYFNACLLSVRPEQGLLQKWSANFIKLRDNPVWNSFFTQDEQYRIFLHQAVMVGTMLSELNEEEFEIYPVQVNFPLYTYPRHPHKPEWINELITCRLELLDKDDCWKTWLPMREPLKSWLLNQYEELGLGV